MEVQNSKIKPKLQLNHIWHKITREQFNAFAEDGMSDFEELDWDLLFVFFEITFTIGID